MPRRNNLILAAILALAAAVRLVGLNQIPPSLNWDEVSHGYNAYSILTTGRDEWGEAFPTIFRAYGDYKLPVYIYATTPFIYIFGLNAFSVRLASSLAGVAFVYIAFLIGKRVDNEKMGILMAGVAAVTPWSLFLSRAALEANLALALVSLAFYLTYTGLENTPKRLISGAFLFGLSVWTYNSARVFTPLLVAAILILYKGRVQVLLRKERVRVLASAVVFLSLVAPMFIQLLQPEGQARFGWLSIVDSGAVSQIESTRANSSLPDLAARLAHNRPVYFALYAGSQYVKHFSPGFLFINGGDHYQFSVPGFGLLYALTAPFILIGLLSLYPRRKKGDLLMLAALVLAPVPASIVRDAPHTLRSVFMFLPLAYFSAKGILISFEALKKYDKRSVSVLMTVLALGFVIQVYYYFTAYIGSYKSEYSWAWQYGHKEVVSAIKNVYADYDAIIMTKKYGEPHEFVLFYWRWSPEEFIRDENLIRFSQSDWFWIDAFGKFYFVNDWDIPEEGSNFVLESGFTVECSTQKCLLVTTPGLSPAGWTKINEVLFLDKTVAFEFYERH